MNNSKMDMFYTKLGVNELNLVGLIGEHFKASVDITTSNLFIGNSDIASVFTLNQIAQRVTINRYLTRVLLIYRSLTGININNILPYMANDGLTEDWVTVMKEFVVPYFKEQNVLKVVHGIK